MERQEKKYAVYLKIGQNELAVSGEDQDFVKNMLAEFKEPFFRSLAGKAPAQAQVPERGRKAVVVSSDELRRLAESETTTPAAGQTEPVGEFAQLARELDPRTSVDAILVLLYHMKNKEAGKPLKPRQMIQMLRAVGFEPVKAFSSNLEYLKRKGLIKRDPSGKGWVITEQGTDRVEKMKP